MENEKKEIQRVKTEMMSYPDASKHVWETSSWLMAGAKPVFASVVAKKMDPVLSRLTSHG